MTRSSHEPPQESDVQPENDQAPLDVADAPSEVSVSLKVGEPLPAIMRAADMMALFHLKKSGLHKRIAAGHFDKFELSNTGGPRTWSGHLIEKHLRGEAGASRFVHTPSRRPKKQPLSIVKKGA